MLKIWSLFELGVVDLSSTDSTCDPIPLDSSISFEFKQSAHGTFVGGDLLICSSEVDECYVYDDEAQEWNGGPDRVVDRFMPYGLDVGEDIHWVSGGGETGGLYGDVFQSEIFDGSSFEESVELPVSIRAHCAAHIGDGQVVVVSGIGSKKVPTISQIFFLTKCYFHRH